MITKRLTVLVILCLLASYGVDSVLNLSFPWTLVTGALAGLIGAAIDMQWDRRCKPHLGKEIR